MDITLNLPANCNGHAKQATQLPHAKLLAENEITQSTEIHTQQSIGKADNNGEM